MTNKELIARYYALEYKIHELADRQWNTNNSGEWRALQQEIQRIENDMDRLDNMIVWPE